MKIHCIRHEPFEGLACIEDWIKSNKHELTCTYTYLEQKFPSECIFDLLIIMGGTASIYDSLQELWYLEEKKFLEKCIKQRIKILGICLGSQILASILGSSVYKGRASEIGWFPVKFRKEKNRDMDFLPDEITSFHWHGDTFDLPEGALHLASSEATPNQAFIYNGHIYALQFHLEMTPDGLKKIIRAAGTELSETAEYIQTTDEILSRWDLIEENNQLLFNLLDYISKQN